MSRLIKHSPVQEVATQPGEAWDVALTLQPAELEEIITRLCACGTRRIEAERPPRAVRQCAGRLRAEWCRLGERATAGTQYVETRFG